MAAPKGNEFYKMVHSPTGRPPKYENAEDLWTKALEYFKWVKENPLYEQKGFGTGLKLDMPKMRAMTEIAFCLWAGIGKTVWQAYKSGEPIAESNQTNAKDFMAVSNKIADIIYQQKFEGASADLLNANIIARELGLVDKKEVDNRGDVKIHIIDDPGL